MIFSIARCSTASVDIPFGIMLHMMASESYNFNIFQEIAHLLLFRSQLPQFLLHLLHLHVVEVSAIEDEGDQECDE